MFYDLQILMSVLVRVSVIRMQSALTLQAATLASVSQTILEMAIPVKVSGTHQLVVNCWKNNIRSVTRT